MFWINKITCDKTFRISIYLKLRSIFFHSYWKLKTQFILLRTLGNYLYLKEKRNSNSWRLYMFQMHMNIEVHVSYMCTSQYCKRLCNCTWLSPLISWVQVADKSGSAPLFWLAQPFQSWDWPCTVWQLTLSQNRIIIAECTKSFIWFSIIQKQTIPLATPIMLLLLLTSSLAPTILLFLSLASQALLLLLLTTSIAPPAQILML